MTVSFNDTAFPNGIASGDVTQTSAVLWTHAVDLGKLTFQISTDPSFHHVVKSKKVSVTDSAVPVKVEFDHLKPDTEYFYRAVDADGHVITGSFATAASLGSHDGFNFGVFGDFSAQLAPFPAMSNAAAANLDLAIMLGDTVYADLDVNSNGQFVPVLNPTDTLQEFQARTNDVQISHFGFNFLAALKATTPTISSADDHEVIDNFAGGAPPGSDPRFDQSGDFINETQLFANGLKAFSQYNAIQDRTYSGTGEDRFDGAPDLYRYNTYGSDAAIIMVDQRTFRDPGLFPGPNPNPPPIPFITQSFDPNRTLLGDVQLERLEQDLLDARDKGITWKFVVLQEPIQNFGPVIFPGDRYEGYAAERTALLKFIDDNHIENVVFVSSDSHWYSVNNLTYQLQPFGPQIQSSAIEVNTMAIGAPPIAPLIPPFLFPPIPDPNNPGQFIENPNLTFYNSLPNAPDSDDIPNDKDDFIKQILNTNMAPLGYDPIGLSPNQATLTPGGDYFVGHDFGWTDFNVDPNGQLVVTTYGIPFYTPGDLAGPNSAAILNSTPQIVSQFTMNPTSNSMIGTAGNDQLNGTANADVLLGADGNDKLNGQNSDDYVDGGKGNDKISGDVGNDRLFGRDGNDKLTGGDGDDQLTGGNGNDSVLGNNGNDRFFAEKGDGNDQYDGGQGSDTLDLSATSAPADVNLTKGSATSSDIGHDKLSSIENVIGSTGDDTITGSNGANRLEGGAGNDTLNGMAGNDVLIGGPGNDTFVFTQGFGMDTITGFTAGPNPGPHDIITFDDSIFADFTAVMAASAQIGADTVITADASDTITLTGVLKTNLHADDFSFV
jgi:phosphodiesterase/alkaline phosphatase D-like protein